MLYHSNKAYELSENSPTLDPIPAFRPGAHQSLIPVVRRVGELDNQPLAVLAAGALFLF